MSAVCVLHSKTWLFVCLQTLSCHCVHTSRVCLCCLCAAEGVCYMSDVRVFAEAGLVVCMCVCVVCLLSKRLPARSLFLND